MARLSGIVAGDRTAIAKGVARTRAAARTSPAAVRRRPGAGGRKAAATVGIPPAS